MKKFLKKRPVFFPLLLIIFFGAVLRLYQLDKFPPSLFGDEVDVGYQAYSILKTGKDYMGQPWPISFHSFADWRTPLYLYSAVPFVAVFGLNEWGVRLPAAIFGILTLPALFLLIRRLFKKDSIALLGTFFLSVSMWHLQYSRAAFEVTLMLLLLILGIYFFLLGLEKEKYLFASVIFLGLSPYSYNTAKLFLVLLLLILLVSFFPLIKKISFKKILLVGLVFFLVSLPMAYDVTFGKATDRFSILSIFTDPTVVPQIGFDRQVDMKLKLGDTLGIAPSLDSRLFHNKFLYWGISLLKNYFDVFSTDFLFTRGDVNLRHSVQGNFGQLYWLEVVFLFLGLLYLFKEKSIDKNIRKFIVLFLFFSPLPSILTRDGGQHATRLILLLLPLSVLLSLGAYYLLKIISKTRFKMVLYSLVALFFSLQFCLYLHHYYVHYPLQAEEWWHYGYKQMAEYVRENEQDYHYVVFSDRDQPPLVFSLFWLKINPVIMQENKLVWTEISDAILADHLVGTKYYFGHVSEERIKANGLIGTLKPDILYLMPGSEIAKDFRHEPVPNSINLLKTIYYPSGRVANYIMNGI